MPPPDLHLHPHQPGDAAALHAAIQESLATAGPWMTWCTPDYDLDRAARWLEDQAWAFATGTGFEFAIKDPGGRLLGGCGLNQLDEANQRANLGYWVRAGEAGRGVATEAARQLVAWAFRETGLVRLEVVVACGNRASLAVARKLGARPEGRQRLRLKLPGGWSDAELFAIVRPGVPELPAG